MRLDHLLSIFLSEKINVEKTVDRRKTSNIIIHHAFAYACVIQGIILLE